MQIKYGFKKEWLHSSRTFRLAGLIITILSFSISIPLLYKMLDVMLAMMESLETEAPSVLTMLLSSAATIENPMGELSEIYSEILEADVVHSLSITNIAGNSLLIVMLILMDPCGGEQKKRATIIPSCSGLEYFDYLVPKFVLYPVIVFVCGFLSALISGYMCNAMFETGQMSNELILIGAVLCAVFMIFVLCIFMAIGLCTSRPGVTTVMVYLGLNFVPGILSYLGLNDYHPFTLYHLISGGMYIEEGFSLADSAVSITVGAALSLVICGVMFFMTHAVLKAKKITNQEDKPEF